MSPEWATVILTAIAMIASFVAFLFHLSREAGRRAGKDGERMAVMEVRQGDMKQSLDRLTDILMQSGRVQVVNQRLGKANSPMRAFDKAYHLFDPIAEALKTFYVNFLIEFRRTHLQGLHVADVDREFYGAVAIKFKDQITKVCEANDMPFLAGTMIAVEVAKGSLPIGEIYSPHVELSVTVPPTAS